MEPTSVSADENVSEVVLEAPKLAVPVGTTAGDQLAPVSKSELPGAKTHVAFWPYAPVTLRPRIAPTNTRRMLLRGIAIRSRRAICAQKVSHGDVRKRSTTSAPVSLTDTGRRGQIRKWAVAYRETDSTGNGNSCIGGEVVTIPLHRVQNATQPMGRQPLCTP
jgi:hypothetical protein